MKEEKDKESSEEKKEEREENVEETEEDSKGKKIKNLISTIILLAGLFVGSLFVDIAQLVKGGGFSQRVLNKTDVFESEGKTWVAYKEPLVKVTVITDDSCEACKPDEILVWLRRAVPTILTTKVDRSSDEGKKLISDMGVNIVPAFVFSQEVESTGFFQQAAMIFDKKDSAYVLKIAELGLESDKYRYVATPTFKDNDIQIGSKEAKVKMIEFSDFQCPYCRTLHATIKNIMDTYGDKVLLVFKNFPLDFHPQAENAALAAECANEQGKFAAFADKLFNSQDDWGKTTGTQRFKTYAMQLGLKTADFNKCLDDKKYQDKISQDKQEGMNFGISGTPAIFINGEFRNGAVSVDEMKSIIDQELAK
jgi:protein-disulfide isomerase